MNVPFKHAATVVLCVVLVSMPVLHAQEKEAKTSPEKSTATRVYDVKSFLQTVSNYPYRNAYPGQTIAVGVEGATFERATYSDYADMGGMAMGAVPGAPVAVPPSRGEELLSLIRDTVEPESWRENGGAVGGIRLLGSSLIVTQTPENHQQVVDLLEQLRDHQHRAVRVRANWITLTEATEQFVGRQAGAETSATQGAVFPVVNLSGLTKAQPDAVRYRGEIICFNGQTVHIAAGRGRSVVTQLNPVVGQSSVGYDPKIEFIRSGAMLQVTPSIEDGGTVVVDLQSSVNELDEPSGEVLIDVLKVTPSTQSVTIGGGITQIDRLSAVSQNFATTVRLPVGKPVLIGGMTMSAKDGDAQQLYLVLEVVAGE